MLLLLVVLSLDQTPKALGLEMLPALRARNSKP